LSIVLGHLLGSATAVQAGAKKDHPAGTSWTLPGSHPALLRRCHYCRGGGGNWLDFFDKFEEQRGERTSIEKSWQQPRRKPATMTNPLPQEEKWMVNLK
jgi:hypothetical protein